MGKFARCIVLVAALLSSFAALSSVASAVTWHNTGDSAFTATGGAGTLSSTAVTLGCAGSDASGTVPATPFVGTTLAIQGTINFTGCTLSGQSTGFSCSFTLTGTAWDSGTPAVTTGSLDATCDITLVGFNICHIDASVSAKFQNAIMTNPSKLLTLTAGVTMTRGSSGLSCPLGEGDSGHWTPLIFTAVDTVQPLGPVITRTA
jgi:hypothetical protein